MPKTFKGFVPSETVTFDLESPDGTRKTTFRCRPNVPGSRFLEFMSRAESTENFGAMASAVKDIIDVALDEQSAAEFWAFVDVPENGIGLDTLAEIAGFLSESFAGNRPTARQTSLIAWLTGDPWIEARPGSTPSTTGGLVRGRADTASGRNRPTGWRSVEISSGVVEKEVANARSRALRNLDANLETAGTDDETGLPAWVVQHGVAAADGSTPFG